jgi:NADPH:quinone reductase-like Zn-dependent oxidoreductase
MAFELSVSGKIISNGKRRHQAMTHQSSVAWLVGERHLQFRDVALDDSSLAPDGVLAQTQFSCISPGTEIAAFVGLPPLRPMRLYPRLVGYCNVARVLAVGAAVETFTPGDIIYTHQSHRSHFICRTSEVLAVLDHPASPGELIQLAPMYLYHLSYNALLRAGFFPGMRVAVIGLGCLGLTALQLLLAFSTPTVGLTARDPGLFAAHRGSLCDICDSAAASDSSFDIVVVTSNAWRDWKRALELARKGGTIASLAFPGRGESTLDYNPLDSQYTYDKQLNLIFCGDSRDLDVEPWDLRFTLKRNCQYLLTLIAAGRLQSTKLISAVASWHELPQIYEDMADRRNSSVTNVLDWTLDG